MVKNRGVLIVVMSVQVIVAVLYIHQSSRLVQESYRMQHNQALIKQLEREKQELLCRLNAVQNRAAIQQFAHNTLGMRSITLNQINKLSS